MADEQGNEETNWIKGVFINDKRAYTTFLQTSFDSEYFDRQNNYTIRFDNFDKNNIARFLDTPYLNGWTEKEYRLNKECYKVIVSLNNDKWTIKLRDTGEQDIPFLTDFFGIWLRVKAADSFWNDKNRTVKNTCVKPMNT